MKHWKLHCPFSICPHPIMKIAGSPPRLGILEKSSFRSLTVYEMLTKEIHQILLELSHDPNTTVE